MKSLVGNLSSGTSSMASSFPNRVSQFFVLKRCKHCEERFRDVPADCNDQNLLCPKSAVEAYKAYCSVFYQVTVCYYGMRIEDILSCKVSRVHSRDANSRNINY